MKYGFVTISVKDMKESESFYKDVLGLTEVKRFSPHPGVDIMFLKDGEGNAIELVAHEGSDSTGGHASISIGFEVDSMEATMAMLKEKGIVISRGPQEVPGGVKLLFIKDPNGIDIEFVEGFKL